jgi:peptidoglycan L-alanyl-D-glutamate endopeptidase CwlK
MPELTSRSLSRLAGVHPHLVEVMKRAADTSTVPFQITEGVRTLARQKQLVAAGASQTLRSRHLTGHAVDVVAMPGGRVSWEAPYYHAIRAAVFAAADDLDVIVRWGGDWDSDGRSDDESFFDSPHFELPRSHYGDKNPARDKPPPVVSDRAEGAANMTLAAGRRGDDVRALQTDLNRLGAGLTVDGIFGLATDTFVRSFQKSNGLTVDGVVGPKTRKLVAERVKAAMAAAKAPKTPV